MAKVGAEDIYETVPIKPLEDEDDNIIKNVNFCPKGVCVMNICTTLTNTYVLSSILHISIFQQLGR